MKRPPHSPRSSNATTTRAPTHHVYTCLAHQLITSTAPTYLSADIQLVSQHGRRHLRSSSYRTLAVPRTRATLGDRSFAVAGPRVWNSLLATIRQITSYGQFTQHLKTGPRNRSALTLDYCALYKYFYILTYCVPTGDTKI